MKKINVVMTDGANVATLHASAHGQRRGGVVLIQEIFGLSPHIEAQCEVFAQHGFEVLAPALFDRERPGLNLDYADGSVREAIALMKAHPFEVSLSDAARCVALLAPAGRVFMVGYCYGGSVTYASACQLPDLSGAACYYGGMLPALATRAPRCPTIIHLGQHDDHIPAQSVAAMLDRHAMARTFLYDAGHGFNSDRRADHHGPSARLALERTLELFETAAIPPRHDVNSER